MFFSDCAIEAEECDECSADSNFIRLYEVSLFIEKQHTSNSNFSNLLLLLFFAVRFWLSRLRTVRGHSAQTCRARSVWSRDMRRVLVAHQQASVWSLSGIYFISKSLISLWREKRQSEETRTLLSSTVSRAILQPIRTAEPQTCTFWDLVGIQLWQKCPSAALLSILPLPNATSEKARGDDRLPGGATSGTQKLGTAVNLSLQCIDAKKISFNILFISEGQWGVCGAKRWTIYRTLNELRSI